MSDQNLVPMIAPDGTSGSIPSAQVQAAVEAGGKLGIKVLAPDGTPGTVPMDRAHDAIKAGGRLAPPPVARPTPGMHESVLGNLTNPQTYFENHPDSGLSRTARAATTTANVLDDAETGSTVGLAKAAGSTLVDADNLVRHVLNKAGATYSDVAPEDFGLKPDALTPSSAVQKVGAMGENVLEFIAGDEAVKGMAAAEKYKLLSSAAQFLAKHPIIGKLAEHGLNGLRQGAIGGAQAALHGATGMEAAQTGAVAGGLSAGLGAVGDAIGELKPGVEKIADQDIPTRASQESKLAKTVESAANPKLLQQFDVEKTQPAAKRAIGNIATDVKNTANARMVPSDSDGAIQKLRNISTSAKDLRDAALQIKAQSKPVFEKLDELTKGDDMKFSDWQKQERSAIRRGDYEGAAKARSAQEAVMTLHADQFNPSDLEDARNNWRQASAIERVDKALNTKAVVHPTPEAFRTTAGTDPGYINGKNFSRQIQALRTNGSLQAAGLTAEHVQSLQNIGTLLERGNVPEAKFANLIEALSAVSKKVSGAQWVVGKLMTSPKAAGAIEGALKSSVPIAGANTGLMSAFDLDSSDPKDSATPAAQVRPPAGKVLGQTRGNL